MTLETVIVWLVVGLIAGWLASLLVGGPGGLVADIIVGIVGAFIGGWIFSAAHVRTPFHGFANAVFVSFVGAVGLLLLMRLFRPRRYRAT